MDREAAKATVKSYLGDYLQNKGINTSRPFKCLNPAHPDKHPSMSYDRQRQRCKCFSCGASYDIFDIIGMDYGLTDPGEIFAKAYQLFNITIDGTAQPAAQRSAPAQRSAAYDVAKAAAAYPGSPAQAYLRQRGISDELAARFRLGYDPAYRVGGGKSWQVLIIPTEPGSCVARNIDPAAEDKERYRNKGASQIFNAQALYSAGKPVFITEGEIDALSIIEAGGDATGLGSKDNAGKLLSLLKQQPPARPLIIALDNDKPGQEAAKVLIDGLTAQGISFYPYNPYGDLKDANAALVADRDAFIAEVAAAEGAQEAALAAAAEAAKAEYFKTCAYAHIADFIHGIVDSANTPAISTGFLNLDEILDGGLYPGLYVLGAISSLGKTTLALQIADQIAQQGQDVLVFSLEMARSELMAKSISRHTFKIAEDPRNAKTTRGILAGGRYASYSKREVDLIGSAIDAYKE